jgi:hypothetical protein
LLPAREEHPIAVAFGSYAVPLHPPVGLPASGEHAVIVHVEDDGNARLANGTALNTAPLMGTSYMRQRYGDNASFCAFIEHYRGTSHDNGASPGSAPAGENSQFISLPLDMLLKTDHGLRRLQLAPTLYPHMMTLEPVRNLIGFPTGEMKPERKTISSEDRKMLSRVLSRQDGVLQEQEQEQETVMLGGQPAECIQYRLERAPHAGMTVRLYVQNDHVHIAQLITPDNTSFAFSFDHGAGNTAGVPSPALASQPAGMLPATIEFPDAVHGPRQLKLPPVAFKDTIATASIIAANLAPNWLPLPAGDPVRRVLADPDRQFEPSRPLANGREAIRYHVADAIVDLLVEHDTIIEATVRRMRQPSAKLSFREPETPDATEGNVRRGRQTGNKRPQARQRAEHTSSVPGVRWRNSGNYWEVRRTGADGKQQTASFSISKYSGNIDAARQAAELCALAMQAGTYVHQPRRTAEHLSDVPGVTWHKVGQHWQVRVKDPDGNEHSAAFKISRYRGDVDAAREAAEMRAQEIRSRTQGQPG